MTFDYDAAATDALALLTDFGTAITLQRTTGEVEDPVAGTVTGGAAANVTTTGVVLNYKRGLIDGDRIQQGDRQLILSNEQVPTLTDKPLVDGESMTIVDIEEIKPAGTVVAYKVQVR